MDENEVEMDTARPSDMASPPAKRRRRRISSADARDATQCGSHSTPGPFWFADGDLVLEVKAYRFKVHRARLACSEIFADMLALPQPANAECVAGAPLVRLADSARDWLIALEWMYDPTGFVEQSQQHVFEILAGALRIAAKYEIEKLRIWAVAGLCHMWPEDLSQVTTAAIPHAADMIALARMLDIPALACTLPTAFYTLSIPCFTDAHHTLRLMRMLSPADMCRLLSGAERLHRLALKLALDPLGSAFTLPNSADVAAHGATLSSFCTPNCAHALENAWRTLLAQSDSPGGPWGLCLVREILRIAHDDGFLVPVDVVCERCRFSNESLAWIRLRELKKLMPRIFDL